MEASVEVLGGSWIYELTDNRAYESALATKKHNTPGSMRRILIGFL